MEIGLHASWIFFILLIFFLRCFILLYRLLFLFYVYRLSNVSYSVYLSAVAEIKNR